VLDHARANPGKLAYSSAGIGSYFHMMGEVLKSASGVEILHVPYKGAPPALAALVAGDVQLMFNSAFLSRAAVAAGKVKLLAVNEDKRYAGLPGVPAIAETLPGFEKLPSWYAFFGPAGMQRPVVDRLNAEMNKALNAQDMLTYLEQSTILPIGGTPEHLAALLRSGIDQFAKAVKLAGLKPE
jgi:tripartite-type tricarboxylate transporter receptor subunit TctC